MIVITEMPGISPKVLDFARRVAGIGCTAVVPHLFGRPGYDWHGHGRLKAATYLASSVAPACISREFAIFATGKTSPVVSWLRALAAAEHERCGGPGVGAVGMCATGGFALAMAVDDRMLAPVLSQPSLPMGLTKKHRHSIDISPSDLDIMKHRCAADGLQVIGLRFISDSFAPEEALRKAENASSIFVTRSEYQGSSTVLSWALGPGQKVADRPPWHIAAP